MAITPERKAKLIERARSQRAASQRAAISNVESGKDIESLTPEIRAKLAAALIKAKASHMKAIEDGDRLLKILAATKGGQAKTVPACKNLSTSNEMSRKFVARKLGLKGHGSYYKPDDLKRLRLKSFSRGVGQLAPRITTEFPRAKLLASKSHVVADDGSVWRAWLITRGRISSSMESCIEGNHDSDE